MKGRVNKGMMPFSRGSVAGRFSIAEPQVPANAVPETQAVLQNDPPPVAAKVKLFRQHKVRLMKCV